MTILDQTLLASGVDSWNATRQRELGATADLSGCNLSGWELAGVNFAHAILRGADLNGANLRGTDLTGADLRHARLDHAVLDGATLSGARLGGSCYSGWSVKDVVCAAASWDEAGETALPYMAGVFSALFDGGLTWSVTDAESRNTVVSVEEWRYLAALQCAENNDVTISAPTYGVITLMSRANYTLLPDAAVLQERIHVLERQLERSERLLSNVAKGLLEAQFEGSIAGPFDRTREGDVVTMPVLALDVVGFSRLSEARGTEIQQTLNYVGAMLVNRNNAVVANEWGDALTFVLRDVNDALAAGLSLVAHMAADHVPVRVGLSYGRLTLMRKEIVNRIDYVGDPRSEAARLEAMAEPGEVLASPALARSGLVDLKRFQLQPVKRANKKAWKNYTMGQSMDVYEVRPVGD